MKAKFTVGLVSGMLALSTGYAAAKSSVQLRQINGVVLVGQVDGFKTVSNDTMLGQGDRVMIMDGASATMVYADGCKANYAGGQIITIESVKTCKGGKVTAADAMYTETGDSGNNDTNSVSIDTSNADAPPPGTFYGMEPTLALGVAVAGGAVLGGVIGYAVGDNSNDSDPTPQATPQATPQPRDNTPIPCVPRSNGSNHVTCP